MDSSYLLKIFATIGLFIGPVLLAIRGGNASAIEKFCYVTIIGPLTIVAFCLRYAQDKRNILKEPDPVTRLAHLEEKFVGFRKILIILLIASSVSAGTAAWLLFRPTP